MSTWDALLSRATFGLSAQAISGNGYDHPRDPSDLVRCVAYCQRSGITDLSFMATQSQAWARLVPEWNRLVALLQREVETRTDGKAPDTYREMLRVVAAGTDCSDCGTTGRAGDCPKCKGTGRRCGGRCRACCGVGGNSCRTCWGNGFTKPEDES